MDGISVFRNNSNDTWPIYLAFNELTMASKFTKSNIILAGIWCGQTKINNFVILNESMKAIHNLEKGIILNDKVYRAYVIYGSFDKPAKSLIYNAQSCTSKYGCLYCMSECVKINRKPVYLDQGMQRTHEYQIGKSIKASNQNKPDMGLKGISSLR